MNMKSMSMYSTQYLVGSPFAWITAAMRRGMESISLWHCSGVMRAQVALIVAFSSSALLGLAYRIFLFTTLHRFSMGLRSGEFGNAKFTFIREHNFGPLSSSPVLLSLAQARRFWCCLLFKSGLTQGMRQLKPMSCIRLCVVVLEALTPAAVHSLWISPTFWMGFVSQSSPGCGYPYCLYTFFYHIFSFPSPLY